MADVVILLPGLMGSRLERDGQPDRATRVLSPAEEQPERQAHEHSDQSQEDQRGDEGRF